MESAESKEELRTRLFKLVGASKLSEEELKATKELPPYNQYVEILRNKIMWLRVLLFLACLIGSGLVTHQALEKRALFDQLTKKEFLLVPGTIPNVIRVRANTVSDALIFEFADWFVDNLGNINYDEAPYKVKTLAAYMSPRLKSRFVTEMRSKTDLWRDRQVDQRFSFQPVKTYERKTTDGMTSFTVQVWGTVRKSIEGRELPSYRERITVEFQTKAPTSEKIWFFEVTRIERKTAQEVDDEKVQKQLIEEKK